MRTYSSFELRLKKAVAINHTEIIDCSFPISSLAFDRIHLSLKKHEPVVPALKIWYAVTWL